MFHILYIRINTIRWLGVLWTTIIKEYHKQGYTIAASGKTKLAHWDVWINTNLLLLAPKLLVYYIEGDVSVRHVIDLCQQLIRMFKARTLMGGTKVHLTHSGELDSDVFDELYHKLMGEYNNQFDVETKTYDQAHTHIHVDYKMVLEMGLSDEIENRQALNPNLPAIKSQRVAPEISINALKNKPYK